MIAIVNYDAGNLKNVEKAFKSFSRDTIKITNDKKDLQAASHIVLPGVGAFKSGMASLERCDLIEPLRCEIAKGKPFLGICLGMQMLLTKSFENGETKGLDIISGSVKRFDIDLKIPHIGWNAISCEENLLIENSIEVYFVHSYHACDVKKEHMLCTTEYGIDFTSGVQSGNVYGLQFHPERSGEKGIEILKRFYKLK